MVSEKCQMSYVWRLSDLAGELENWRSSDINVKNGARRVSKGGKFDGTFKIVSKGGILIK